jgi:hypothetical protein
MQNTSTLRPLCDEINTYSSDTIMVIVEGANYGSLLGDEAYVP